MIGTNNKKVNNSHTPDVTVEEKWREIGFHRPLGGLLYNLVIIFIAAGFGIFLTVYLIPNVILPFPEALGLTNLTTQMFSVYFTLLDLGIGSAIQRFVAEENVKSPRRAIRYIQFFIWYQLFSGLLQVTFIAVWVFTVVPKGEVAYAAWFFLLYSTVQYPGMLGIFRGTLEAYQRYDRAGLIGFIQTQVIDNIMRITCILLGRWLGSMNPAVGEVMGATAGAIIGTYIREFITAYIAAVWCRPILKQIDPTYGIRNLFHVEFDWADIKKCISFGLRTLAPGLISPLAEFLIVMMYVAWLPSYSSLLGLFMTGEMLAHMVCTFSFSGLGASISESYNNNKFKLTRYYIEQAYKWQGMFGWFMIGLLYFGASLIGTIIGENWQGVTIIIQVFIFFKLAYMFGNHLQGYLNGVGKPEFNIFVEIIKQSTRLGTMWFFLVIRPSGLLSLVYSLGWSYVATWLAAHIIFHFKVMKIRINLWQTFIAPMCAAVVLILIIRGGTIYVMPIFKLWFGNLFGVIILIMIFIAIGPLFIFFPVYALMGGWDDGSLLVLQRAVGMSGPSQFYIKAMYRISNAIAHRSLLTNKFPIKDLGVAQEIQELTEIRKYNLVNT